MYKYKDAEEFLKGEYIHEDGNRAVLMRTDPEYLLDIRGEVTTWYDDVKAAVKCQNKDDLCAAMFSKQTKTVLAGFLEGVCSILRKQDEMVQDLCVCNDLLKTQVITSQSAVIKLQGDLLKCNAEKFEVLQSVVKTTVQNTVQEEIKSYSSVVAENTQTTAFTPESLKRAFQDVVKEEDRSKNLMVFGLKEEQKEEDTSVKISDLFQQLGEKPRVEAVRVGKKTEGKSRPVKVTLSTSTLAHHILMKASKLRRVEQHKNVFISPDRSPEQRAAHRELVLQLKKRAGDEPSSRHYIRGGKVFSVNKVGT